MLLQTTKKADNAAFSLIDSIIDLSLFILDHNVARLPLTHAFG